MLEERVNIEVEVEGAINTLRPLTKSPVLEATMANRSLPNSLIKIKMCSAPNCDEFARKRSGLCILHYARHRRGTPLDLPKHAQEATFARNREIVEKYQSGLNLREVAAVFGMTVERVRQILIRRGIPRQTWEQRNAKLIGRVWSQYLRGTHPRELSKMFRQSLNKISKFLKIKKGSLSLEQLNDARRTIEISKFWQSVDKQANEQACWVWAGSLNPVTGYGRSPYKGKWIGAHIVSWQIYNGRETTLHILHSCDNPPCVNPAHLREGTPADNMRDRDRRGRAGWQKDYDGWRQKLREGQRKRTDYSARRRLTDSQIEEIRRRYAAGESGRALGVEFGCHFGHISRIARGDARRFDVNGNLLPLYPPSEKVHKLFRDKFAERNG